MENIVKSIYEKIKESKTIVITGHQNPDGDTVGAGIAMYLALKNAFGESKAIDYILEDPVPKNLKFLVGADKIERYEEVKERENYELMISLDVANYPRIGAVTKLVNSKEDIINIDHHISNQNYGGINLVRETSSTCELLYEVLVALNIEIDKDIANALYTGIVNDTGNFAHANTTSKLMRISADLIDRGAENVKIIREFFNNKSFVKLKLIGEALSKMTFFEEYKLNYFFLTKKTLDELGATKDDTEGLVELLNSYEKSSVALFLREEVDGAIKGSFRSKFDVDVNKIAGEFNGGGHIKAAGFKTSLNADEILEIVKEKLK